MAARAASDDIAGADRRRGPMGRRTTIFPTRVRGEGASARCDAARAVGCNFQDIIPMTRQRELELRRQVAENRPFADMCRSSDRSFPTLDLYLRAIRNLAADCWREPPIPPTISQEVPRHPGPSSLRSLPTCGAKPNWPRESEVRSCGFTTCSVINSIARGRHGEQLPRTRGQ
jgi:hypothetical protein